MNKDRFVTNRIVFVTLAIALLIATCVIGCINIVQWLKVLLIVVLSLGSCACTYFAVGVNIQSKTKESDAYEE